MFLVATFLPSRSFSQLALGRNKWVGNILGFTIPSDFSKYWNQITPENNGKWGSVESSPGVYNWTGLDNDYNYALQNGFLFKEHNLIWGSQQPGFLGTMDSAQQYQEIVNWIDTCGHRYPEASFCDVVNEPVHTRPAYKNALGGNGTTGWDWVIEAYELARQYWSPNTKLLINEYNILNSTTNTATYVHIIRLLQARGLIDGIGVQAHYFSIEGTSLSLMKQNLDTLASTELPIYISEFDINDQNDLTQLQNYETIFPFLYQYPDVKGITLWGYVYAQTWKPYTWLDSAGVARPALQWLSTYLVKYLLQPAPISPVGTTGVPRNPTLEWHPSIAASSYRLQIGTDDLVSTVVLDSTVSDTLLQLPALNAYVKYYWHVAALNASDTGNYSAPVNFTTGDSIATGVNTPEGMPVKFELMQNYPNPFNPSTIIDYQLPVNSHVTLRVYDLLGRLVETLVNESQSMGSHEVSFSAGGLPSGVYFYRLSAAGGSLSGQAGSYEKTLKLMLIK